MLNHITIMGRLTADTELRRTNSGKAVVSCQLDGKVLDSVECRMGQFGRVEHLPAAKFSNKKAPAAATLNAETGVITLYDQP